MSKKIVLAENLRFLRKNKKMSQSALADALDLNRSQIGSYEEGRAEPKLPVIRKIADYFSISIDELIFGELAFKSVEKNPQNIPLKDASLRILTVTVEPGGQENIVLIPEKASAGYADGYADTEYLSKLPSFRLPMLGQGTYRAFEISGDSMLPLTSGSIVIGEYVEKSEWVKNNETYIVVTRENGIVYKRITRDTVAHALLLHSDNPVYKSYAIELKEICEVWRAKAFICSEVPAPTIAMNDIQTSVVNLFNEVHVLKEEVKRLKEKK